MTPGEFPPEKDLAPGDKSVGAHLPWEQLASNTERALAATKAVRAIVDAYDGECDIIMLAVPAGKGMTFIEGINEALNG